MRDSRRQPSSSLSWLLAGFALFAPGYVLASQAVHPAGAFVFAGAVSYSMTDLNTVLRDYSRLDPTFTGGGDEIKGGLCLGGGIRAGVTDRVSLILTSAWMNAESKGATTISGQDYAVRVTIPAVSFSLDAEYSVPLSARFSAGALAGVGYYMTTGQLKLTRDFLQVRSDLDAEAFGIRGAVLGSASLGRSAAARLSLGYRHAHARSLRVDNVEVRTLAGDRIAPDWSGADVRFAIEAYFAH